MPSLMIRRTETKRSALPPTRISRAMEEAPPWLMDNIAELSRSSRTIHTVYVGFLIYCAVTIITTEDRKLIINDKAHLPIINLDVPLSSFVLIAPVVAIIAFVYFQLHMQALIEMVRAFRAMASSRDSKRIYPWMIAMAAEPDSGLLGFIHRIIATLSMWLLLPATLFLFEWFTLKKHDLFLATWGWINLSVALCLVFWLWFRYDKVQSQMEEAERTKSRLERYLALIPAKRLLAVGSAVFLLVLLLMIPNVNKARTGLFNVDMRGVVFVVKDRKEQGDRFLFDLQGIHLEGANLNYANLEQGNLEAADLSGAALQGARLIDVSLIKAYLSETDLSGALLQGAKLNQAILSDANLDCADLSEADLTDAILDDAFLMNTKLGGAKLTTERLSKVVTLFGATFNQQIDQKFKDANPKLFVPPTRATVDKLLEHVIAMRKEDLNPSDQPEVIETQKKDVNPPSTLRDELVRVHVIQATQEKPFVSRYHQRVNGTDIFSNYDRSKSNYLLLITGGQYPRLGRYHLGLLTERTLKVDGTPVNTKQIVYAVLEGREMIAPCGGEMTLPAARPFEIIPGLIANKPWPDRRISFSSVSSLIQ